MSQEPYANQSSFQRVTQDIVDLFELQMQLLSVDSFEAKRKLTKAIACAITAVTLAGSALTVVMIGAGVLLDELTELSTGASLLIVSGVVFAIVALLGWLAITAIKKAASAMSETKSEFSENLRWLKATILTPKTSARNQIRRDSFDDHDHEAASSRASGRNGSDSVNRRTTPTYQR